MICTGRRPWLEVSMRNSEHKRSHRFEVDLSHLTDIVWVDRERMVIKCEPMVCMSEVSVAVLPLGMAPQVLPELDDLTVGRVINGYDIEGSSHMFGLFSDTCVAYELVLTDGSLVRVTADNEYSDLFHAVPWSHGFIGSIFTLQMGQKTLVIITCPEVAHEALIEKGTLFANRPPDKYGSVWRTLRCNHHSEPNIYVIAAGFLAVSSVSTAQFIWGLVKWRKMSKEKASVSINSRSENALIFPALTPPLPAFLPESYNFRISDFIFDPEIDYAQVLDEAQKFVAKANLPETATTTLSTEARPSQGHTSKSGQEKLLTDNTLEEKKSKSSWKNSWVFWQRSKRNDNVNGYCSVSTTPAYPSWKALKRSLSGPMTSYSSTRKSNSNSGPIYSDGLPLRPANRSRSGSLGGFSTPDRSYAIESTCQQS